MSHSDDFRRFQEKLKQTAKEPKDPEKEARYWVNHVFMPGGNETRDFTEKYGFSYEQYVRLYSGPDIAPYDPSQTGALANNIAQYNASKTGPLAAYVAAYTDNQVDIRLGKAVKAKAQLDEMEDRLMTALEEVGIKGVRREEWLRDVRRLVDSVVGEHLGPPPGRAGGG